MTKKEEIEKLEKRLAELKSQPDFEVGKWYKAKSHNAFFCYKGNGVGYGIRINNVWIDEEPMTEISLWTEATKEEVESALIKQAEKRGFKEGVRFKSASSNMEITLGKVKPSMYDNLLYMSLVGVVFCNGKWAEIIEEPKVEINGYEMKQDGDIISFGCAKFRDIQLIRLYQHLNVTGYGSFNYYIGINESNRKIKSITLNSGVEITVKQLKQIVDNIK